MTTLTREQEVTLLDLGNEHWRRVLESEIDELYPLIEAGLVALDSSETTARLTPAGRLLAQALKEREDLSIGFNDLVERLEDENKRLKRALQWSEQAGREKRQK